MADIPPKKKYPAPFSLRLSKTERKALKELANGQPLGQFIRDAIFKHGKRPRKSQKTDPKQVAKLLGALGQSRISSNINQLAKAANSGSLPVNDEINKALNEAVNAIQWMRKTLIKSMGVKSQSDNEADLSDDT
ncbi:MAG: hypothetical protein COA45_04060 [Zetaproteobacteria bacterium]|nr:MAG: hypothetical protein COA45_04060 [Zetaproteobacteria bacterium]